MNAIVMNTLNGAVTEYSGFGFHAITPTHAGSVLGLYALGGDDDAGTPIVGEIVTGKTLLDSANKKSVDWVYFSLKGGGTSTMTVHGEVDSFSYDFPVLFAGESRCRPGRGIRENYLAFGYANSDGCDFELDRIDVTLNKSTSRKV